MAPMSEIVHRYLELVRSVALGSGPWMVFNTILATVPAVLAVALLHRDRRRSWAWWAGVGAFVLFLPNAPYVVTDVIHLRGVLVANPGTPASAIVPAGALAALVLWGVSSYAVCLSQIDRAVRRAGWSRWRVPTRAVVHLLCAFGVVLGRVPRLHSWHVVTRPAATVDGIVAVLHPLALPLVAGLAVAFALAAAAVTAVGRAAWARTLELADGARRLAAGTRLAQP